MVRAGVVKHPSEWAMCGYNEIQNPPERYGVIDMTALRNLCGFSDPEQFPMQHRQWVEEGVSNGKNKRESCWTESIAVGGIGFVEGIKARLGIKGKGRRIEGQEVDLCVLREESESYSAVFDPGNGRLSQDNSYYWNVSLPNTIG